MPQHDDDARTWPSELRSASAEQLRTWLARPDTAPAAVRELLRSDRTLGAAIRALDTSPEVRQAMRHAARANRGGGYSA